MERSWFKACFWSDPYILDLSLEETHLYIYLITNQKIEITGCLEISYRTIEFETKLSKEQIDNIIQKLEKNNKITIENNIIILHNFLKNQNFNKLQKIQILRTLSNYTEKIINIFYSIENIRNYLIEFSEEEKENETVKLILEKIERKRNFQKENETKRNFQKENETNRNFQKENETNRNFQKENETNRNFQKENETFGQIKENKIKEKEIKENIIINSEPEILEISKTEVAGFKKTNSVMNVVNKLVKSNKQYSPLQIPEDEELMEVDDHVYLYRTELKDLENTFGTRPVAYYVDALNTLKISESSDSKYKNQTDYQRLHSWMSSEKRANKLKVIKWD